MLKSPVASPGPAPASTVKALHEATGTIGDSLVGLQAAAALYHRYAVHDDTLWRMPPHRGHACGCFIREWHATCGTRPQR